MPSLSELQRGFAGATIFGDSAALAGLGIVAAGLDPATRIGVYRNNVFGNYRKALAATYPVIRRLVGPAFFDAAIDAFVRGYPSQRGDVNRYGAELPRFLADYRPAQKLAYLPDVARLEWAVDQAGIAADALALETAALAAVPVETWGELRLLLHPSVRLIESCYPILRIWRVNQPDAEDQTVDLGEGGEWLLVQVKGGAKIMTHDDWNQLYKIGVMLSAGGHGGAYSLVHAILADWPYRTTTRWGQMRLSRITGYHVAATHTWPTEPFSIDEPGDAP